MHFERIRDTGFWTLGSPLLPTEMESVDANLAKAINGDEGGVWAPSSAIEVGGQGFKITGGFWSTGAFRVDALGDFRAGLSVTGGNVSIALNLAVQGNTGIDGTLHVGGVMSTDANINTHGNVSADGTLGCDGNLGVGGNAGIGGTCMVVGNTTLGGTLAVTGGAAFGSTVGITGNVNCAANVGVGGTLTVGDVATFAERATFNGGVLVRSVLGHNGNNPYSVNTVDEVIVDVATITADVIYTLDSAGAVERSRIRFTTVDSSHNVVVVWAAGSKTLTYVSGSLMTIELVYLSGAWRVALLVKA